jgi:hypothetical protein
MEEFALGDDQPAGQEMWRWMKLAGSDRRIFGKAVDGAFVAAKT